jgi:PKD repeat protein
VSYQWTFDDGTAAPAGASATHAFTTPGVHTATLTATDAAGVQASKTVQVTVVALPPPAKCNGCACGGTPCKPLVSPHLSGLAVHPSRFRAPRRGSTVLTPTTRGGALVTFTLSARTQVQFTPARIVAGVMRGAKCVAAGHGVHGRRCTRLVALRGFARRGVGGANSFRFSGRIAGHALPPGRYELIASVPGSTLSVPFTIVK